MPSELTLEKMKIADRLTKLEVKFEERWEAHDKGSNERAKRYSDKIGDMCKEIKVFREIIAKLPCDKAINDMSWVKNGMYLLFGVTFLVIAAIVKMYISGL